MALVSGECSSLDNFHFLNQMLCVLFHQGSIFSTISSGGCHCSSALCSVGSECWWDMLWIKKQKKSYKAAFQKLVHISSHIFINSKIIMHIKKSLNVFFDRFRMLTRYAMNSKSKKKRTYKAVIQNLIHTSSHVIIYSKTIYKNI